MANITILSALKRENNDYMSLAFFVFVATIVLDRVFASAVIQRRSELVILWVLSGYALSLFCSIWLLLTSLELVSYLLAHIGVVVLQMSRRFARVATKVLFVVAFLRASTADGQSASAERMQSPGILFRASFSFYMMLLIVGVVCGVIGDLSWLLLVVCCSTAVAAAAAVDDDCRHRRRSLLPAPSVLLGLDLSNNRFDDCVHLKNGWFCLPVLSLLLQPARDVHVQEPMDMDWEPTESDEVLQEKENQRSLELLLASLPERRCRRRRNRYRLLASAVPVATVSAKESSRAPIHRVHFPPDDYLVSIHVQPEKSDDDIFAMCNSTEAIKEMRRRFYEGEDDDDDEEEEEEEEEESALLVPARDSEAEAATEDEAVTEDDFEVEMEEEDLEAVAVAVAARPSRQSKSKSKKSKSFGPCNRTRPYLMRKCKENVRYF